MVPRAAVLLLVALAACGGDDGSPAPSGPVISVQNNVFAPDSIDVTAGTEVTFRWANGSVNHNVTPWDQNAIDTPASPQLPTLHDAPFEFSLAMNAPGTFRFYCQPHGGVGADGTLTGMAGVVRVQ